jgi:gamma-D-glutamyl-L-lysine dipeptidyl-peptidase
VVIMRQFRRHLAGLLLLVLAGAARADAQVPASPPAPVLAHAAAHAVLEEVRGRIAPDRRVALFDLTIAPDGDSLVVQGEVGSGESRGAVLQALRAAGYVELTDRIVVLPDAGLGRGTHGLVRVSVANVRRTPAHAAELVTQAVMGWPVRLLKEQSGWWLVHTEPDGYLGWIEDLQLARVTPDERQAWESGPQGFVTVPHAAVREAPSEGADPVTDLVIGSLVGLAGVEGAWARVILPDGRGGFVDAAAVEDHRAWRASREPTPESVLRTARLFMGVPYLWGGTSAKGFDCSGLSKTVYRLQGIELPRDADQQAQVGRAVAIDADLSRLRAGDLLFFGAAATAERRERITHVALYAGDGEFIHASGLVRRNSLVAGSPVYSARLRAQLLHGRRLLPDPTASVAPASPDPVGRKP